MMFTKEFAELSRHDTGIAGGKGASLGEMTTAGIPVPPGFVVLADSFERFLAETDLGVEIDSILHTVDTEKMHTVEHASERIQKLILEAKMPGDIATEIVTGYHQLFAEPAHHTSASSADVGGFVAVRSSATAEDSASAAWAGQLDSFLNTDEHSLLVNVQRCWASLFTPRAVFYRFEKGLHTQKISVAVVVQKMIQSEVSGIAFSVHPVTEDYNQLIIEAGFGLGEAIVSGQITPDSYVVEKSPRRIIDKNIAEQDRGIYRKGKNGMKGEEQEIHANEWREIPTSEREKQKLSDEQILELSELIIKIENHYGFPCDIEWAFEACPPNSAEQCGQGKFYIVQSRPITTLTQYAENIKNDSDGDLLLDVAKWKFWGRWKMSVLGNAPWTYYSNSRNFKKMGLPRGFRGAAVNIDGYVYAIKSDHEYFQKFLEEKLNNDISWFDEFFEICEQSLNVMNRSYSHSNLADLLDAYAEITCCSMMVHFCDQGFETLVPEIAMKSGLSSDEFGKVLVPYKLTSIMQYKTELRNLQEKDTENFLKKYQWLGVNCLSGKRLEMADIAHEREASGEEEIVSLPDLSLASPQVNQKIAILQKLIYYRSANAEAISRAFSSCWEIFDDIASQYQTNREQLENLTHLEIINLVNGEGLPRDFKERSWRNGVSSMNGELKLYFGKELDEKVRVFEHRITSEQKTVSGSIAFKGKVRGIVKIVENVKDLQKVNEGDILVAPETTPDYIIGMKKAGGFVTNQGGITSHAAIVARELKKPCIIGTKIATKILHDGDLVEVDACPSSGAAHEGVVRIIEGVSQNIEGYDHYGKKVVTITYEEFVQKYKQDEWIKIGKWKIPFLTLDIFFSSQTPYYLRKYGIENLTPITYLQVGFDVYVGKKEVDAIQETYLHTIGGGNEFIDKIDKMLEVAREDLIRDADSLSIDSVPDYTFLKAYFEKILTILCTFEILRPLSSRLEESIAQRFSELSIDPVPLAELFEDDTQTDLYKLAQELKRFAQMKDVSDVDLGQLIHKYGYAKQYFLSGEGYTKEEMIEMIRSYKYTENTHKTHVFDDPQLNELIRIMNRFVIVRLLNNETANRALYQLKPVLEKISQTAGVPYENIINVSLSNFFKIAQNEKCDIDTINTDAPIVLLSMENDCILPTDQTKRFRDEFLTADYSHVHEFKGTTTHKGIVRGIVKIIQHHDDFSKFNTGEILVCSMTDPNYLPLMHKASAFVTDMGGILCHAAIISREMKKPCIIGTKIATQVLHDGDLVEVDAERGIITILERAMVV